MKRWLQIVHLTIMKTFHKYLSNSLLSSSQCDDYQNIPKLLNYLARFNPHTWVWKDKLTCVISKLWGKIQSNSTNFYLIQLKFQWKHYPCWTKKKKNIVFSSIHFNLWKFQLNIISFNIFEFNWIACNSSCIMQIHSLLNYSNRILFLQNQLIFFINSSSLVMHSNVKPKLENVQICERMASK
jgi:hypothetical protein